MLLTHIHCFYDHIKLVFHLKGQTFVVVNESHFYDSVLLLPKLFLSNNPIEKFVKWIYPCFIASLKLQICNPLYNGDDGWPKQIQPHWWRSYHWRKNNIFIRWQWKITQLRSLRQVMTDFQSLQLLELVVVVSHMSVKSGFPLQIAFPMPEG